jgi:hypothetical protein
MRGKSISRRLAIFKITDSIKIDLQEVECGSMGWLRIETGGGHLWIQ